MGTKGKRSPVATVHLRKAFGADHPSVMAAAMHHGAVLHVRGSHSQAAAKLRSAHEAQVAAHGRSDHPDVLETAWRLGCVLAVSGTAASDAPEASTILRSVAEHQSAQLGDAHPRTLRTRVSLGEAVLAMGGEEHAAEAARLFGECEVAQRAVLEPSHPDLLKCQQLALELASRSSLSLT